MKKSAWRNRIQKACQAAGTYRECFNTVIDTLADILEKRDNAQEIFKKSGGNTIVKHVNKGGGTFLEKNPALVIIDDLNRTALTYWRDLGLTPKGLKAIDEKAMKPQKKDALAEVLKSLGD